MPVMRFTGEPEDVDRLLWCLPPAPSPAPTDDGPSFEFEFADQSLPDVYKLPSDESSANDRAAAADDDDDWVLFADVSTALSVKTVDALVKLLDDENAVTAVPVDRFNERAILRKSLGRQPSAAVPTATAANRSAERPLKDDTSTSSTTTAISTAAATATTTTTTTTANTTSAVSSSSSSSSTSISGGEQIVFVRYDRKLKQLLGVDVYTVS